MWKKVKKVLIEVVKYGGWVLAGAQWLIQHLPTS